MAYKPKDFTVDGKCSRCGSCCSNFLPLTRHEMKRLRRIVTETDVEIQIKSAPNGSFMMMCPFLIMNNEGKPFKCSIYRDRPAVCRVFQCNDFKKHKSKHPVYLTDIMKDIVHYDYQKDAGVTYEEAWNLHMKGVDKD